MVCVCCPFHFWSSKILVTATLGMVVSRSLEEEAIPLVAHGLHDVVLISDEGRHCVWCSHGVKANLLPSARWGSDLEKIQA